MAFDPDIDLMIQEILGGAGERKTMFGGICYLVAGKMVCGVYKDGLMAKVGPETAARAIAARQAESFAITGKPMTNWVLVKKEDLDRNSVEQWIRTAIEYVGHRE